MAGCSSGGADLNADAGDDFAVDVGSAPTFDGCGSSGDISNYQWTITSAPEGSGDAGKVLRETAGDCQFELESSMLVDDVGEWTIELVVTDGDSTASDEVVVTVAG